MTWDAEAFGRVRILLEDDVLPPAYEVLSLTLTQVRRTLCRPRSWASFSLL